MSTQNLNDVVRSIVTEWVEQEKLFTALDVSLAVKQTMPHARHREVREVVRQEYASMQNSNYGKSDIDVTLEDGTVTKAILYHPLADSWDLDNKYDAQKRAQTLRSSAPVTPVVAPVAVVLPAPTTQIIPLADLIKQKLAQNASSAPVHATPASKVNPNKHLWDSLFDSAPSLFPRR